MTFTITFSDVAENHVGMGKIGSISSNGLTPNNLIEAAKWWQSINCETELYEISPFQNLPNSDQAILLIVRNGLGMDLANKLYYELLNLNWDTKAYMYGRVVNKHARYNLCFADYSSEPDYQNKLGRIISWNEVPYLSYTRNCLIQSGLPSNIVAEGNFYYNNKCYIGWHGDAERKIVVACRIGQSMNLQFQWKYNKQVASSIYTYQLNHGDLYYMSEKLTGNDCKKTTIPTVKHRAGYS